MYLNDWKDCGKEQLAEDFGIELKELDGCEVLLASYGYEDYEGDAFVLFRKDGKLFEIHAGHCSCYGLEAQGYGPDDNRTQWEPEETTLEALSKRLEKGYVFSGNEYKEELRQVVVGLMEAETI